MQPMFCFQLDKFLNILFERIESLCSAVDKSIGPEELEE